MLASGEEVNGVRIVRVWSTRFGRAGLFGRAIDYATFYVSAFFAIRRHRRDAVVVPMTDPPLISVIAAAAAPRVVNWVQDLFPEVAEGLGIRVPRFVRKLRDWSLRHAKKNVVLGARMAEHVPNATIIHNWADAALRPVSREWGQTLSPAPREGSDPSAFVVGYSGNFGRAHEFDTILAASQRLPHIRFLFIGGGAKLDDVKRRAGANATFLPYQPREALSESLSVADVHLVSLQPQLEGLIVPSKFYGVLAVGRPVVFIGARDGELARIIDEHRCGIVVEPGNVDGLTRALTELASDRQRTAEMGRRGLDAYRAHFAPQHAFAAWERVLHEARA